jgi:hypothetical protein
MKAPRLSRAARLFGCGGLTADRSWSSNPERGVGNSDHRVLAGLGLNRIFQSPSVCDRAFAIAFDQIRAGRTVISSFAKINRVLL